MFKALKSLVFVEEGAETSASPSPQAPQLQTVSVPSDVHASTTGGLDTATLESLLHSRIQGNEAFALTNDFLKVNESLVAIIADEPTRFKAAAAASKSDPGMLVASANSFEATLAAESENFNTSFVGAADNEIATIEQCISASAAEIQRLTEELGRVSAEKAAHDADLIAKKSDLAKSKIDFASVSEKVRNHYASLVSKLSKLTTV